MDPYRELGLSPEAASEPELVRAAFKALAKKYHPYGQSDPRAKAQAEEKMARLNEAQRLILSGEYRPPSPSTALVTAVEQPDRPPVETPKPVRPSAPPRQRRVPIAPMAAAAGCLLFALLSPSFFQKRHLERARQLETSGQYQQALDEVNESIKSDSRNGEAFLLRARLWQKLGYPDRAKVDLANARTLVSPNAYQSASLALSPTPSPSAKASPSPKGGG